MSTQDYRAGRKYRIGRKSTEVSAADSANWGGEETEELVEEEEANNAGGEGEVRMTVTETEGNWR